MVNYYKFIGSLCCGFISNCELFWWWIYYLHMPNALYIEMPQTLLWDPQLVTIYKLVNEIIVWWLASWLRGLMPGLFIAR